MLTRLRWFLYGVVLTVGATAYVVVAARRMRERLSPETVARAGAIGVADVLEWAGRRLASGSRHTAQG